MDTETKRIGFFDQVIYSVQPSKFGLLLGQKRRKVISYTIILMVCLTLMNFVVPVAGFFASVGGYDQFVTEGLPDIELKEGTLQVGSKIEIGKNSATHVLVDTSVEKAATSDINEEDYIAEVIVTKNNMVVYNSGMSAVELDFSQFDGIVLNNEGLLNMKTVVYLFLVICFFSSLVTQVFNYLLEAAFVALLCWGPFTVRGAERMKFTKILAAAIYAKSVPELFVAFNNSAGWISNTYILSYVAIGAAVFILMSALRKTSERKTA